jgi:hypothetical protein
MRVIPFKCEHLEVSHVRDLERMTVLRLGEIFKKGKVLQDVSKESGTFIHEGRVITCAGFIEQWPGVCEVWQIPSVYTAAYPLAFARTMKRYVEQIAETFKYRRMQTTSLDDELHSRWMTWIGFQKEGTLRQYDNLKNDYCQWARMFVWE